MGSTIYANLLAAFAALFFLTAPSAPEAYAQAPADVLGTLSTRAHVGTNGNVLISAFVIAGSDSKQVLVRGLGPSLAVSAPLADPVIELYDATGALVRTNNNWKDSQQAEIAATGYAPSNDAESAMLERLGPGHYTTVLRSVDAGAGVGKIEIIDVDAASSSRLDNSSTRAAVAAGENALVAGFVINGPQARKVMTRGIGPSLAGQVDGALSNPTLQLRDSSGNLLVFNDNWEDTQRDAIIDSSMPPSRARESAIIASLAPGSYTAELIGACGGSGVAVVDVYDLGAASSPGTLPISSPATTCFTTWAAERNLTGAAAARTGDPDRDGIPNLLEYALGKNPNVPDGPATNPGKLEVQGQRYLSLSFTLPTGDNAPDDVDYTIERAAALAPANWSAASTNFVTHSTAPGPGDLETVTVRSTRSMQGLRREFLRLTITSTAP